MDVSNKIKTVQKGLTRIVLFWWASKNDSALFSVFVHGKFKCVLKDDRIADDLIIKGFSSRHSCFFTLLFSTFRLIINLDAGSVHMCGKPHKSEDALLCRGETSAKADGFGPETPATVMSKTIKAATHFSLLFCSWRLKSLWLNAVASLKSVT